ncbi:unnamed protein product [Parajaminaea phylloscopi]
MASSEQQHPLLPPEDLASHAQTCEVIFAMWGGQDELIIDGDNEKAVQNMVKYLSLPLNSLGSPEAAHVKESLPSAISFALVLSPLVGSEVASVAARKLVLDVSLPLRRPLDDAASAANKPRLTLRHADWLSRQQQEELRRQAKLDSTPTLSEDDGATLIMDAVEALSEAAALVQAASGDDQEVSAAAGSSTGPDTQTFSSLVLRTWNHLPSLSTKEKREDLCSYAQAAQSITAEGLFADKSLTGFVLAGKPGLVVLECPLPAEPSDPAARAKLLLSATQTIDAYWSDIKSRSWADIPSGHKKVSETLREEFVQRAFTDMAEITGSSEIGGKEAMRGGWRNDMSRVEGWLKTKGIGGRLRDVLGAEW